MMTSKKVIKSVSITVALLVTAIASIGLRGEAEQVAFGSIEDSAMTNDSATMTAETAPDVSLVGSDVQTEPQVNNFNATLYMVSNADGTALHPHQVSDFVQTAVLHEGPNSTTVNGTFTITLEEGPVENVNGYIHVIDDKIEFWIDPAATGNHFGPTTITGMVLSPERFGNMRGHEGMTTMTSTTAMQQ